MKIALSDWRKKDLEETLTACEQWPSFSWQGIEIDFKIPVHLSLQLSSKQGSLFIRGKIAADLELACSRCAEPFVLPIRCTLSEVVPLTQGDDSEEYWDSPVIDRTQDELDLSELSLQVLLENLPLQPLCRQDCRGLCPKCGQNLNDGDCGCQTNEIDPRLAVLGQLLRQDKQSEK